MLHPHKWFTALGIDLALLVACLFAVHLALGLPWLAMWPALFMLVLLIGSLQHGVAVLAHEGAHRTIHPNPRVNDALGQFAFLFLGGNLKRYRAFHSAHHAHTGIAGMDPELTHVNHPAFAADWPRPFRWGRFLWQCVRIMFLGQGLRNMVMVIKLTSARTLLEALPNILFFGAAIAVCLFFGWWWVPVVWAVSLVTSFWLFLWFEIFTEHQGAMAYSTRSFQAPLWMRLLTHPHNIWMHDAHHADASIPFYELRLAPTARTLGAKALFRQLEF